MKNSTTTELKNVLQESLGLEKHYLEAENPPLLDALPQLDSASVLNILMEIEEKFDLTIAVETLDASIFTDFSSLRNFVENQINLNA